MNPSDLLRLLPDVDFGAPIEHIRDLPELPKLTDKLRRQMQRDVKLHGKPALRINDADWGWLYLILAKHEQMTLEAEGLDASAPPLLPNDSKNAMESVHEALVRAEHALLAAMRQPGVPRLLKNRDGDVDAHIQQAITIVKSALASDAGRRSRQFIALDEDGTGRLEALLSCWWQQCTGKPPSLSKSGKKNGDPPAYVTFLALCFSVLSKPPMKSVSADAVKTRRKRREKKLQALSSIVTRLPPMPDTSISCPSRRKK
jgi:hypothetical protein